MTINVNALIEVSKILKKKTGYSLWGYFWRMLMLALAILCFIGGSKLLRFSNKVSDYKDYKATTSMTESVTGKIISSERTDEKQVYKSTVEYKVDSTTYNYIIKAYSTSRPEIGEEVTVKYVPSDPKDAGIQIPPEISAIAKLIMILTIVLFLFGGVFTFITIFIILRVINPKKKVDKTQSEPQYYAQQTPKNQQTNYQSQNSTYSNDNNNV